MSWAILATASIHGVLAVSVSQLPASATREATVITVREVKTPKPLPPPPPPPPPTVATAAPAPAPVEKPAPRKRAPTPAPVESAPAPSSPPAPAALDLKLGNGGNGPAVAPPVEKPAPPPAPVKKTLEAKPAESTGCDEAIVKPTPINVVQPAFTTEAREAAITGKVRVEITISAEGTVTNAKVIAGLGYGLDEAALEAAKASTFSPATKCGAAVETTFTIGMRFQ